MTEFQPKFPTALKDMVTHGVLSRPASVSPLRPEPAPSLPSPAVAAPSTEEQPAKRGRGRPPKEDKDGKDGETKKKEPKSSYFGASYRLGAQEEPASEIELEELKNMKQRTLLFQRSEKRGASQWNTVSVYDDGVDIQRRTVYEGPAGPVWQVHNKLEPTIWNRPVFPVATVLIHSKQAPSTPETDPTSERKIRWRGRDYNAASWSEAIVSLSFDNQEIKAQKADSWFPIRESNWTTGILPWFRVLILNDPATLMRNPTDPVGTVVEDLPKLPVEHMWSVTGWCSSNKYGKKSGETPVWEHITPGHKLYAGHHTPYVAPSGDVDLYFNAMRETFKKRPLLGVFCAMACGSFAHGLHDDDGREFRGDTSTLVNLWGDPGCGKSTTAQAMVALIGNPIRDSLIVSHTTDAGLELMAYLTNHGFFVIDELQKHLSKKQGNEAIQHLMGLLNGQGKLASANGGMEIRDRRTFDNLIVGTANIQLMAIIRSIAQAGDGHFADALEQRVIELHASDWSPFPAYPDTDPRFKETQAEIKDLTATLSASHGHAYEPLIAHYRDNRVKVVERLRELQKAYSQRLTARAVLRQVHFFAYTQVGLEALKKIFQLEEEVVSAIQAEWERMIDSLTSEAKKAQDVKVDDVIDRITSWAEANGKHFAVRVSNARNFKQAYAWPTGKSQATAKEQETAADYRSQQAEASGVWGYFVQDEVLNEEGNWSGELWITQAGKDAMEKDRLTSLPLLDLLQRILAKGWVDATFDSKGKLVRLDKKLSNGSYVYKILIGKAKLDMEHGEEPLAVEVPSDTVFPLVTLTPSPAPADDYEADFEAELAQFAGEAVGGEAKTVEELFGQEAHS